MELKSNVHVEVYLRTREAEAFISWRSRRSPLAPVPLQRREDRHNKSDLRLDPWSDVYVVLL